MEHCKDHTSYIERIRGVEESTKSAHLRINKLEENQEILMDMNASIKALTEQSKGQKEDMLNFKKDIKEDINEVKNDVKELKEKPAKRWETIVTTIITVFVSGLVGAVLALIIK
jgi:phage-related minor tail protein